MSAKLERLNQTRMKLDRYFKDGIKLDNTVKFSQDSKTTFDLMNEMRNFGLRVDFIKTGELTRVPVTAVAGQRPDKSNERSGWYIYHQINSDFGCAVYGNWRTGEEKKWYSGTTTKLSQTEQNKLLAKLEEVKKKAAKDKARKHEETSIYVKDKFKNAKDVVKHAYLDNKQIESHGIKQANGNLLIPMYRIDPEKKDLDLRSIQYIMPDGSKRFASAGETKGNFFLIGTDLSSIDQVEKIAVVEGYATGYSVWHSCNIPVLVVFSALFCKEALTRFRKIYNGQFILALDNDDSGVGQEQAKEVQSVIYNCISRIPSEKGDYNDLFREFGAERVKNELYQTGFQIRGFSIRDLQGKPLERKYIVDNLIPQDVAGVFAGLGGVGKSGLLLDLALKVARGAGRWLNQPIMEGGDVVFLTGEDSQDEIHHRLYSIDPEGKRFNYPYNVYVYCVPDNKPINIIAEDNKGLRITEAGWELQEELVSFNHSRLLIIDPLSSFCSASVSSSNEVGQLWGTYVAGLAKKTNSAVITSHHMSKSAFSATDNFGFRASIRGASAIVDSARWAAVLTHVKEELAEEICLEHDVEPDVNRVAQFAMVKSNGKADFTPKTLFRKDVILEPIESNKINKEW